MRWSDDFHWQFQQKFVYFRYFCSKADNFVVFASTYVSRKPTLFLWRFLHEFIFCWQCWSVKRFIASIFKKRLTLHRFIATNFYSALLITVTFYEKLSLPLLLKCNSSLNNSSPLLFKVTLPHLCISALTYLNALTFWSTA